MMYRLFKLSVIASLAISVAIVITSCTPVTKPLDTKEDVLGFITEITPLRAHGLVGQILVESHADKLVNKWSVTIKSDTMLFMEEGGKLSRVDFQDFAKQQWVKVWFDGPVAESFPMQGRASQIVIVNLFD